mgnify:CR=1 FL=1
MRRNRASKPTSTNTGTISVNAGTLNYAATLSNSGTFTVTDSMLNLARTFTPARPSAPNSFAATPGAPRMPSPTMAR